jgi:hypothetical protein
MTADRWFQFGNDTLTRQSFTATAPEVPNGLYYLRYQATQTGAYHYIETRIENGHNDLSGKTVTISFWGKSNTGSNNSFSILTALNNDSQLFSANFTLTTIWTKYFATFTLPIINFAATYRYLRMGGIGDGGGVDIAQVQYEIGSAPTHFSRAGGDLQGEIAKCQRYFVRYEKTSGNQTYFASGNVISTTRSMLSLPLPVNMRATPSISRTAGVAVYNNGSNYNLSSLAVYQSAQNILNLDASVSSGLTNNTSSMFSLTTNGDYLDFSAEL